MSTRSSIVVLGTVGLILVALPLWAQASHKSPKTTLETATIENSGSTNTLGYTLEIRSDGLAFNMGRPPGAPPVKLNPMGVPLPKAMVRKFFSDLAAAIPLMGLTVHHGMRSVSFGTRTFITYKGQRSPDLTFGGDAPATALKADIDAITKALHVGNSPRRARVLLIAPPATP